MNIDEIMQDKVFSVHLEDFLAQAKGKKRNGSKFKVYLELMLERAMNINGSQMPAKRATIEPEKDDDIEPPSVAPFGKERPEPVDNDAEWVRVIQAVKDGQDKIRLVHARAGMAEALPALSIALPGTLNPAEFALRAIEAGIDVPSPDIQGGPQGWALSWGGGGQEVVIGG